MNASATEAVLVVSLPERMVERVAGLTVIERQLFLFWRAGIRTVRVAAPAPSTPLRLPPNLDVRWNAELPPRTDGAAPLLTVSGDYFFSVDVLRTAAEAGTSLEALGPGADGVPLRTSEDMTLAEAWLFAGLRKKSDGFMARIFDRHLSLFITRQLLHFPISPNFMTVLSTGIGLLGAGQFFYAQRGHELLGSLLIWLHTVLDGCDGELARLTFRESRWGAWLDFWGDNVVHVALFAGLAVDLRRSEPLAPILGTMAILGALGSAFGSAWLASRHRNVPAAEPSTNPILSGVARLPIAAASVGERLQKLEVLLAQRDFIYVLVLCSLCNHEEDFLWAAGLGAPLYLLIMFYLYRQSRSPAIQAAAAPSAEERLLANSLRN